MIPLWKGFQGLAFWRMYKLHNGLMGGKIHFAKVAGIETVLACQSVAGGTFEPCRKCDYLFNHTSGKVSRGTEVEDLCVKKLCFC